MPLSPPPVCLEDRWSWGNAEAPLPYPQRVSVDLQLILATDEDACRARTFGVKQRYRGAFSPRRLCVTWRNERNEAAGLPLPALEKCLCRAGRPAWLRLIPLGFAEVSEASSPVHVGGAVKRPPMRKMTRLISHVLRATADQRRT